MTKPASPVPINPPASEAHISAEMRRVFVSDLVVNCLIGVHRHERDGKQRVRINIDLAVADDPAAVGDSLANVVCYETVVNDVRALADSGHINLVETLAEQIAATCLADRRVRRITVRVEKLDVFSDAASVGVEIVRHSGFK